MLVSDELAETNRSLSEIVNCANIVKLQKWRFVFIDVELVGQRRIFISF